MTHPTSSLSTNNIIVFHGSKLVTVDIEGHPHVAMRPICEAIGLAWHGQFESIKRDPVLSTCIRVTRTQMPGDDQARDVFFLPLNKLNGWLFKINASRVKPEIRERVINYQRNCYDALYEHFHGRANRQHEKYWFARNPHWQDILPLALEGLRCTVIARRLGISAGRVSRAIRRMIEVGLMDPAKRISARFRPDAASRQMQLPFFATWGQPLGGH